MPDLDGTNAQRLASITTDLGGAAVDSVNGKLYWTDRSADKILRGNLDGSASEELVTTGVDFPTGIAVDPTGGKMYWIGFPSKIQRANLDGTGLADLARCSGTGASLRSDRPRSSRSGSTGSS